MAKGKLFDVLVRSAMKREDTQGESLKALDEVQADEVMVGSLGQEGALQEEILRLSLATAVAGLKGQLETTQDEVASEFEALKQEDPRTVPAITSKDVAERRAKELKRNGKPTPDKE